MTHSFPGRHAAATQTPEHRLPVPTADEIITTHARTSFNFAARFLPQPQRADAIDLYAFFRTLDDLVDDAPPVGDRSAIAAELDHWEDWLTGPRTGPGPREPLATNLARVIDRHDIPIDVFRQMIAGQRADLQQRQFETLADLQTYCYQVASTVGYAMAHILGATSPHALAAAEKLGAAMQLTNILRDVGEDLDAGRLYLPAQLLQQHSLCHTELLQMRASDTGPDARFRTLMQGQIGRAHALYAEALPGIWLLPANCRLPILIASRLYRQLLTHIERLDYDTLRHRAATTRFDKTREAVYCWMTVSVRRTRALPVAEHVTPAGHGSTVEVRAE